MRDFKLSVSSFSDRLHMLYDKNLIIEFFKLFILLLIITEITYLKEYNFD